MKPKLISGPVFNDNGDTQWLSFTIKYRNEEIRCFLRHDVLNDMENISGLQSETRYRTIFHRNIDKILDVACRKFDKASNVPLELTSFDFLSEPTIYS